MTSFDVKIEKIVAGGDGLARYEGRVVFVPETAPGERHRVEIVQEKKDYLRVESVACLESSLFRREAPCPYYGRCGGGSLLWCTTPIEAQSSLGPDFHHPIISLSGIPSAVMVLRILHPILASTLCAANPLARIAEPTIAL